MATCLYVCSRQTSVAQIVLHHTPYIRDENHSGSDHREMIFICSKKAIEQDRLAAGMVLLQAIIDYFSSSSGM